MRIFLTILTLSLCLSKSSFAQGPYSVPSKEVTAHLLNFLLVSMGAPSAWLEGTAYEAADVSNEEDPPPPSPSPNPVAPMGDTGNPFWLIPPTKSPSPSPKPNASPIPLVAPEHHADCVEGMDINRLLNPSTSDDADTSRAHTAMLLLELAQMGNAPLEVDGQPDLSQKGTEDAIVDEGTFSSNDSNHKASLEQAKRLGTVNGLKLVWKGYPLPSDDYLRSWYKLKCPESTDEDVDAYMSAYKYAFTQNNQTPETQAKCLGRANGLNTAWNDGTPLLDDYLRGWYRANCAMATDEDVDAYVSAYNFAYIQNYAIAADEDVEAHAENRETSEEPREVFDAIHEASPLMAWHETEVNDTEEDAEIVHEASVSLSSSDLISMHLSGLSNAFTPQTRAGLLSLGRSESAPIVERVIAAGLLYLSEEGAFNVAAKNVLKELVSSGNLPHAEYLVEYVRSVLCSHKQFADELIARLPGVLAELSAAISSDDDVILCEGKPPSPGDNGQNPSENPRKRKVGQVSEEPASSKEQRMVEGDVCVRGDHHDFIPMNTQVLLGQAECWGAEIAMNAGMRGSKILSDVDVTTLYKRCNPQATKAEVEGFLTSHKRAYAEGLGRYVGRNAAMLGLSILSDVDVAVLFTHYYPQASESEIQAFIKNLKTAYADGLGMRSARASSQ